MNPVPMENILLQLFSILIFALENINVKIFSIHMREEIIRNSLAEFKKNGIRKSTLKDLVAALGISTKTMYKYFRDKEDLLNECLQTHYDQLFEQLVASIHRHPSPVITLFTIWKSAAELDFGTTHIFYEDLNYYYPELQDKILRKNNKKWGQPILKLIEEGKRTGLFRKDLNTQLVLAACGEIYALLTRTAKFQKFRIKPFEVAENTIGVYLRGICTSKGLQHIESNRTLTSFTHISK